MEKKKILFVCSANHDRSPTAENIYKDYENLEVRSAGTFSFARKMITKEDTLWADMIFVMTNNHKEQIINTFPEALDKIIVLHIQDIYSYNEPKLIKIIKEKVDPYIP